jgi:outer membrane cobalamin receptor
MPSASFAEGDPLIRRPKHSAALALHARLFSRGRVAGSVTYVGKREDVDFNQFPSQRVELPGYAIVDLAGEVEILRSEAGRAGLAGILRVENVFNQRYDQVVGFGGRPRGVFGGAKFRF